MTSWTLLPAGFWHRRGMSNALSPRFRAMIINYDPTQPNALSVSEFCKSLKISRSVFYKIRTRATHESTAALHPRSRAPKQPARRYGPDVVNELVRIRKQLKADGWDYGPLSIHYEAALLDDFPGRRVPSVATIARLLASVGQVDSSPRKRPKSSYIPFVRATAMALWQLDAFEYTLSTGVVVTIYQLLDDASRFDVGTDAYLRNENSADARDVLERAITEYGAPLELLSDNSSAFNQLRQGRIGTVEVFLASKGTMPITGLPGKPTTQGKNERSHQTLIRFLDANQPATLDQVRQRIKKFRQHYNFRRPHQSLNQATPASAWTLLAHTPATEPIPLVDLEAKAAQYRARRRIDPGTLYQLDAAVGKDGNQLPEEAATPQPTRALDAAIVTVTKDNHQVYYQGLQIKLPTTYGERDYYRSITDDEFVLADPRPGEVVFSFPLPLTALRAHGRFILSHSIRGVFLAYPTAHWLRKFEEYQAVFAQREAETPEVFTRG